MKHITTVMIAVLVMVTMTRATAAPVKEVDLASDKAWTLRVDGGEPRSIKVTAGGWNSDQQEPQIPSASVKDHVIYQRKIVIPQEAQDNVVKVLFGGCNYGAEVYLDSQKVAEHHAPMTPFEANLTDLVQPGRMYTLRVKAYTRFHYGKFGKPTSVTAGFDCNRGMSRFKRYDGCTKYAYGLTGHVKLAVYPAVHISDVFVRTSVENQTLEYDVWVSNGSKRDRTVSIKGTLAPWRENVWGYPDLPTQTTTVNAGQTRKITVKDVGWNLGPESYWWPNIPFREDYEATFHWLKLSLLENGQPVHRHGQRFGFVEYKEGPYYYTVNGIRFTSFGDSNSYGQVGEYDCWSQTPCFLPPDGRFKGCPETWKRYQRIGFNSMRLSTSVPTRYMLETADEAGYMLIPEGGSWGNGTCTFNQERFSRQLQGVICVCRNHPSVARYSMANESFSGDGGQWRWLIDAALEADPTRPYVFEIHPGKGVGKVKGMKAGHACLMQHYDPIVKGGDFIRGMGEYCWGTDEIAPFAFAAREFRMKDWAHCAPWSWINFWPNFLEGMSHRRHPWKFNNHPDRQDGLNGWDSPLIKFMQKSLHPYLLIDHELREKQGLTKQGTTIAVNLFPERKLGDGSLSWPNYVPHYNPGSMVQRKIELFNGALSGDRMSLRWSAHWDSPEGPVAVKGDTVGPFTVKPGFHTTQTVSFTAPALGKGERNLYLVLESMKDGKVVFEENAIYFTISKIKDPGSYLVK